jgi:hypothetical protein
VSNIVHVARLTLIFAAEMNDVRLSGVLATLIDGGVRLCRELPGSADQSAHGEKIRLRVINLPPPDCVVSSEIGWWNSVQR